MCRYALTGSVALLLALAACTAEPALVPAPGTALTPGAQRSALVEVAGVRATIEGDAWNGDPSRLAELVTPMRVTLENHSGRPLRVSYDAFSLAGGAGFAYRAIPPIAIQGSVGALERSQSELRVVLVAEHPAAPIPQRPPQVRHPAPHFEPRFHHHGFFIAPFYSWMYPGFAPWPYAFPYDPYAYERYYGYWPQRLPTQDMLSQALPEGVLQDGGRVEGFVYFQSVSTREPRVQFEMNLVDATSGAAFGKISVPFDVHP